MKFFLSILAMYAYFSFALLDSLKGLSYRSLVSSTVVIQPQAETETVLIAQVTDNKRVSPFTVD